MLTRQNQEIPFTLAYISLQNKREKTHNYEVTYFHEFAMDTYEVRKFVHVHEKCEK